MRGARLGVLRKPDRHPFSGTMWTSGTGGPSCQRGMAGMFGQWNSSEEGCVCVWGGGGGGMGGGGGGASSKRRSCKCISSVMHAGGRDRPLVKRGEDPLKKATGTFLSPFPVPNKPYGLCGH